MIRIKICGLTRPGDIEAVNRFRPDFAGFVFAPGKRQVTPNQARSLKSLLSPDIPSVGVFVNDSVDRIADLAAGGVLDFIQLHGDETAETLQSVKRRTGLPVIKAVRVRSASDILAALGLPCDYLLLDTYVKNQYGGSGSAFDWSLIPAIEKPWFLAGGIGLSNIEEAVCQTKAWCLDLSSAVETDGKKDPKKIEEIITKIRSISQWQTENLDSTVDNSSRKH